MISQHKLKVIVIGRGIAGLSCAFRLIKAGIDFVIVGQKDSPAQASRCAQGILANKGLIFFDSPLFAAKLKSLLHTQEWLTEIEELSGLSIARSFHGIEEPYWSPEEFQDLVGRIYRRQFWGCFQSENRSRSHWPLTPFSKGSPLGFLKYPKDGWFDVEATLDALELILEKNSVESHQAVVEGFIQSGEEDIDVLLSTGKVIRGHKIVLASGSGSRELLDKLGVNPPKSFVIGGQTLKLKTPSHTPSIQTHVKGTFSATWSGNHLIIGSSSWKGVEIDAQALEEDARSLLGEAEKRFGWDLSGPGFVIESRRGARYRYADRMPAVGPLLEGPWKEKIFFLNGFYKNGLHLADLCSLDLIAYLQNRTEDVKYPDFHPKRLFRVKSCSNLPKISLPQP
jgi:glycine/D-amino acid oxidase-like deaminating enzyme